MERDKNNEKVNVKIFETHAHYDDRAFDEDRDALLHSVNQAGVTHIVNIGCSMESSRHIVSFVNDYDFLYGTVGVHPDDVDHLTQNDMDELKILACKNKILGIGEIGLDYHYDDIDKECQKKWFLAQLELARELKKPVVIHSRDAAADTLDLMKAANAQEIGGVIHCFSYGVELAREYLNMGYYIGVGGVVTFKNGKKLKEVVAYTPLDKIVLETDAPYLAPTPFRGKRNQSSYLTYVANEIAQIKGIDVETVYEQTYQNGKNLYRM